MTYVLPLSPSVALLTVSLSRWDREGTLGKRYLWTLWPALSVSVMLPIALVFTMHKWVPAKHGLSTIHIAIPIIILLIGTLIALFTFVSSRRFFQLKKVFLFYQLHISCYHYNLFGKIPGDFPVYKGYRKKMPFRQRRELCALQLCPNCAESRVL